MTTFVIREMQPVFVPAQVRSIDWNRPLDASHPVVDLICDACGDVLGARRWAHSFVKYRGRRRLMTLCEECGTKAETSMEGN